MELKGEKKGSLITLDLVLDVTGEDDPVFITQLILRGKDLVGIEGVCARRLSRLVTLSLSHNRLTNLNHFNAFGALVELNLNFNKLENLDGLVAQQLTKLYLSNNRLKDDLLVDGKFSSRFPRLTVLCLYHNTISDLGSSLKALRKLSKLRSLDVDGNPMAWTKGFRHRVASALPRLTTLDGEDVTDLDKQLADEYLRKGGQNTFTDRPSTAPSSGGGRTFSRGVVGRDWGTAIAGGGDVKLVGSAKLNRHPVMVEYLASMAEQQTPSAHDARNNDDAADHPSRSSSRPRTAAQRLDGYVGWLRNTSSSNKLVEEGEEEGEEEETTHDDDDDDDNDDSNILRLGGGDGSDVTAAVVAPEMEGTTTTMTGQQRDYTRGDNATAAMHESSSDYSYDVSDPYATIRRLVKMVDTLKLELEDARANTSWIEALEESTRSTPDSADEDGYGQLTARSARASDIVHDLQREVTQLRTENGNMYMLMDENKEIKAKLAQMTSDAEELTRLRAANQELEAEVKETSAQLQAMHLSHLVRPESSHSSMSRGGSRGGSRPPSSMGMSGLRPQTAAQVLDEVDDEMDVEVAALLARNESSLKLIRREVSKLKLSEQDNNNNNSTSSSSSSTTQVSNGVNGSESEIIHPSSSGVPSSSDLSSRRTSSKKMTRSGRNEKEPIRGIHNDLPLGRSRTPPSRRLGTNKLPERLDRGDIVTVHSPRIAAGISSSEAPTIADRWWD